MQRGKADLVLGNNVLAQVNDVNDFVAGLKELLAPGGTVTIEFPHLERLVAENQFDTIYHEHFSYFSLYSAERIFAAHGLTLFDVEELPTHGGSLRIWARHDDEAGRPLTDRLLELRARELEAGVDDEAYYRSFEEQVRETKRKLLEFLIEAKRAGKRIVGYGAPGKGNTLLNYCGIRGDFLDFTVDRSPYKQGKLLPGTHIPIREPERLAEARAGLRADPAVESPRGDHGAARVHSGLGWAVRRAHTRTDGGAVIFTPTPLEGAWLVDLERHEDDRGYFARTWCAREFADQGLEPSVVQCSLSYNRTSGTLRGMHWQAAPHEEAKLVRCVRGAIWDVIIDMRPGSPSYTRHYGVELSAATGQGAVRPPWVRPRLRDVGGRHRGLLSDDASSTLPTRRGEFAGTIQPSASSGPWPTP